VRTIGFAGLALGTSIAAIANAALLLWLLRARLGGIGGARLLATLAKVAAAAVVMGGAAAAVQAAMDRALPGDGATLRAIRLTVSIGAALAALAATAKLLHVDEFDNAASTVVTRVRKLLSH
jgi:putative peptidoglycan lipid II flippase